MVAAGSAHAAGPEISDTWTRIGHEPTWKKTVIHEEGTAELYLMLVDGRTHFAVSLRCRSTGEQQVFQWKTAETTATSLKSCPDRPMTIRVTQWSVQLNPLPPDYSPKMRLVAGQQ